jgi:hypothetical protein
MLVSNLCVRLSFIFLAITLSLFQTSLDSGLAIKKNSWESRKEMVLNLKIGMKPGE